MVKNRISLSMGAGGKLTSELIADVFLGSYGNDILNALDDSAEFCINGARIAFTTDSYTVKPIFFPGGDIGKLCVCGTVNDLCVKGAKPLAISAGFIIEEGFSYDLIKKITVSMHEAAEESGVKIVTGDTKVVGKGEADGIFINTAGIGIIMVGMDISCSNAMPGDDIIITGTIADHGISILNSRLNLDVNPSIESDVASLLPIIKSIYDLGHKIHVMRDPTRGGIATVFNEIAIASKVNIRIFEKELPIRNDVRSSCDMLGLDPLYMANEGKAVIVVSPDASEEILMRIKKLPIGQNAKVIGKVENAVYSEKMPPVSLETEINTTRFIPLIDGESVPRIC